jgi:hypothetical protein
MKNSPLIPVWVILLVLGSPGSGKAQPFSEEDLAATISHDSGHPEEGYRDYARSLARTLSMLNPTQLGKVFKGRGPLRKAEVEAAKQAHDAAKESPGEVMANDQGTDHL